MLTVELFVLVFSLHSFEIGGEGRFSNHDIVLDSAGELQIGRAPFVLLEVLLLECSNSRTMQMLSASRLFVRLDR